MYCRNLHGLGVCAALFIFTIPGVLTAHEVEPEPKPKPGSSWRDDTPINITLQFSSIDTYVIINDKYPLYVNAHDGDQFWCTEAQPPYWADWHDDVTSGNTASNHHVWWDASEGSFVNRFGTYVEYLAPDYDASCTSGVRDVTITVHARDEGPPNCWDDPDAIAHGTVKVWQVTVTKKQTGNISDTNDMVGNSLNPPYIRMPASMGGEQLGWVEYENPSGCKRYAGKTELSGSIPNVPGHFLVYTWSSQKKGGAWYKDPDHTGWQQITPEDYNVWVDDTPDPVMQDTDCRSPNCSSTDALLVYMYDGPGFPSGDLNDHNIPPWTN